jgi:hypothetical protein
MVFLPQFATAGGNSERIRLFEQRKCSFNGMQQMSALFDWLNATKHPVIDCNDPHLGSTIIQSGIANNLSILLLLARSKFRNLTEVK